MKRIVFFILTAFISVAAKPQTATNADGTLKMRGNVAIMTTYNDYTFKNGVFEKQIDDSTATRLKSAYTALAMQAFGDACFGIVNRDNKASENVNKLLEDYKSEDYVSGFAIQAKGQGADNLCFIDYTVYSENDIAQIIVSIRSIGLMTNLGFHYTLKSEPVDVADVTEMKKEAVKMAEKTRQFIEKHILDLFPEQYAIAKSEGKKLYLVAYQPNGKILAEDKWYAFKFTHEQLKVGNQPFYVPVLKKEGEATCEGYEGGYCIVKADKAIQPSQDIVLFRNQKEPMVSSTPTPYTFFPFQCDNKTYDGFIKNRINNAVCDAITRHPGMLLVEIEHLPELTKERELQKTEEFLDGYVSEQIKAVGAEYMIDLDAFVIEGSKVSFQLNVVSVAENRTLRTIPVSTSIDNIENEMYKQICERLAYPCNITNVEKDKLTVLSGWALRNGDKIVINANKQIENPITKEISNTEVQLCKCSVVEYMGNKCIVTVDEVVNEDDFNMIEKYSAESALIILIDGSEIKSNDSETNEVQKAAIKKEKANKRKSMLKTLGKELLKNSSIGFQ